MAQLLISFFKHSNCDSYQKTQTLFDEKQICFKFQFWSLPNPRLKENWIFKNIFFYLLLILVCLTVVFWLYVYYRLKSKPQRNPVRSQIDKNKIIFAFEIDKMFLNYKNIKGNGYLPIVFPQHQPIPIFEKLASFLGFGHYYKRIFDLTKIKQFLSALLAIPRVQIYIYTHLPEKITTALLKQMKLDEYFPIEKRRYTTLWNSDMTKHAIQVDNESRRVVIVTPTNQNHSEENQKYFLVMNPDRNKAIFLRQAQYLIQKIVKNNKSIDNLHEQLQKIKIRLE